MVGLLGPAAGRPVSASLRDRAPPPPAFFTARGPLLAAPPLGPRGPGSDPPLPLLDHRGAGRLRSASARRRRRGLTRRAARASSLRSSGPAGPPGSPGSLPLDLRVDLRARVPVGPPLRPPTLGGVHFMGDVRSLPVTTPHQWGDVVLSRRAVCPPRPTRRSTCVRAGRATATIADAWRDHLRGEARAPSSPHPPLVGGVGGGRGPNLGKHRAGPALMGGGDGLGPVLSLSRTRSRCGTPIPIVIAPDGSNRCRRIKPLRRPTVSSLSLATVEAPTALSLIGCTNCALSRVSFGLNAGGAGAGPGRQLATSLRHNLLALAARPSPPWLNYRLVAQPSRLRPDHRHVGPRCFLSPAAQLPALLIHSLTPGRRRRIATSHGPWAVCQGCSLPCQNEPGPNVAAAVIGEQREAGLGWHRGLRGLPARHVLSLTWPASAVSHLPMAMDVQSGLLAAVSDQTRPQRRCRCHRRAAGGRSWAGTDHGWYSRRVVILEGPVQWHWPSHVRDQLGRRRSGGSPATRGLAGLGDTGLSAARLRAGTTGEALSALPAVCPSRATGPGQV